MGKTSENYLFKTLGSKEGGRCLLAGGVLLGIYSIQSTISPTWSEDGSQMSEELQQISFHLNALTN